MSRSATAWSVGTSTRAWRATARNSMRNRLTTPIRTYRVRVVASQNQGDPGVTSHNTGNGIVLGSVRDGAIEWSTADSNGGAGGDTAQGPAGIWAYDSTDVSIEHSLSYENQTANKVDGNGFDLDQNTSDSVLQDNLSYSNAGAGFLVYSRLSNGAQRDNVVRYNISSGDAGDAALSTVVSSSSARRQG